MIGPYKIEGYINGKPKRVGWRTWLIKMLAGKRMVVMNAQRNLDGTLTPRYK